MKLLLEIACFNAGSAMDAAKAGADRIEICDNVAVGGTTPSYGTLKMLNEKLAIPFFAMIRARGGDFYYSNEEIAVMQRDVVLCKHLGIAGIVLGFLNQDGTINKETTKRFAELAYPMDVTFHRAFDRAKDPLKALEDIIECGCQRILTSGQKSLAIDALPLIEELVRLANDRIIIMPGSGVRGNTIKTIIKATGVTEIHSAAYIKAESKSQYFNKEMKEDLETDSVDTAEITMMIDLLKELSD